MRLSFQKIWQLPPRILSAPLHPISEKPNKSSDGWLTYGGMTRWENVAFGCVQAAAAWAEATMGMATETFSPYYHEGDTPSEIDAKALTTVFGKPTCRVRGEYTARTRGWTGVLEGFRFCVQFEKGMGASLEVDERASKEMAAAIVVRVSQLIKAA